MSFAAYGPAIYLAFSGMLLQGAVGCGHNLLQHHGSVAVYVTLLGVLAICAFLTRAGRPVARRFLLQAAFLGLTSALPPIFYALGLL
ncbi:MAG: hypothetical protein AAF581_22645 [Planctomycetota bacterium]